jgi:DNA-directed RNA polymerase subunit RPC12/RpoP
MRVETFQYDMRNSSWSVNQLPALDSEQTLMLAFGATEIQSTPKVLQVVRSHYPRSHILGCSTAGEVLDGRLSDGTLSAAVINFKHTRLVSSAVVVREESQSLEAGRTLARQLVRPEPIRGIILLAEGLRVDHRALLHGMQTELGEDILIVGALAADSQRYERSWVWSGDRIQSGLVGAVALYGDEAILMASANEEWGEQDWAERVVSKSAGNVIYSLGGVPALDVCRGPAGSGLLPLRVLGENGHSRFVSALGMDEASKAVIFNEPVPQGARVQVVRADAQYLINGAGAAAAQLQAMAASITSSGGQVLAMATSCAGRRVFLRDQAQHEIASVAEHLPKEIPLVGLYSYGELSPGANHPRTMLHDSSLGLVLISESVDITQAGRNAVPAAPFASGSGESVSISASAVHTGSQDFSDSFTSSGSLVTTRPQIVDLGSAEARVYDLGSLRFIALKGGFSEAFNSDLLVSHMEGRVVIDLGGIEMITSFGVRGWLQTMSGIEGRVTSMFLANCSEAVVNQMLMVRNFAGRGQIVSFGAPYICTACSTTFEYVLDCENAAEEINQGAPPDVACPECGNRAVFDEDPEAYLEFVSADLGKSLPFDVRDALAERRLESMTQVDDSIEKRVEGDRTLFRINRIIDERIRWRRVLAGVEGKVRLDFARSKGANPVGADRFLAALRRETDAVTEILLDQVPLVVVEQLIEGEAIPKIRVRTLAVPARCTNCGVIRQASIDPAGIREARRQGLQPESECRRCSGSIPIMLPDAIVAYFEGDSANSFSLRGSSRLSARLMLGIAGAGLAIAIVVMLVILLT